jgi:simple sugar transport system substrate-binding protein
MINTAVANKVAGIVVSLANSDALTDPVKKAVAAGIPVITINSGQAKSRELGALAHVGQDETVAGQGAGNKLAQAGIRKLLCVKHEAANVGLDQRCTGASETLGGQVVTLQVDGKNLAEAPAVPLAARQRARSLGMTRAVRVIRVRLAGTARSIGQANGRSASTTAMSMAASSAMRPRPAGAAMRVRR